MRLPVLGLCVLFLSLCVRAQPELKADLVAHAPIGQIKGHLKALSEQTHEPSNLTLDFFASGLSRALSGRSLTGAKAAALVTEIDAVFKSAGTSTVGFLDHVAKFKADLVSLGVPAMDAERTAKELEKLGREVRGPEDTPVDLGPPRRRFR